MKGLSDPTVQTMALNIRNKKNKLEIITNISTIIGVGFAIWIGVVQLPTILSELKSLSAEAILDVKFSHIDDSLNFGPDYTKPFSVNVILNNIGDRDTDFSEIAIIFCSPVKVSDPSSEWRLDRLDETYTYLWLQLEKMITKDRALFLDDKDTIGDFKLTIPTRDVGVALVFTSGRNTKSRIQIISYSWENQIFNSEEVTLPSLEFCKHS